MDFEGAFSKSDCLLSHWEECFQRIFDFLKVPGNLKEKTTKCLLDNIEDESHFNIFRWALCGSIMGPTTLQISV